MTSCALLIPNTGLLECFLSREHFIDKVDSILDSHDGTSPYVRIDLHRDDQQVGQAIFGSGIDLYNQRAVDAIYHLCGVYFTVAGPAILTEITEAQAMRLIEKMSQRVEVKP